MDKKTKYSIDILIILILINIVYFTILYYSSDDKYLYFSFDYENKNYDVKYWYDENENYFYVFVPSFVEFDNIVIYTNSNVYIDDSKCINGSKVKNIINLVFNKEYSFTYNENKAKIKFLKSNNIATMFIKTQSGTMDEIHKDKSYKEIAKMELVDKNGNIEYNGELNYIKGRGNATWTRDKRSYNIQLTNNTSLLDMGEAKNWCLIANFIDKTNIRNKMIFDFSKEISLEYSPNSDFIDLYLNGEYVGIYLLADKIEIGKNRIDIDTDNYNLTGPYLLEMELEGRYKQEEKGFVTSRNRYFVIKNNSKMNDEKVEYIKNIWQNLEDEVYTENGDIEKYLDLKSWTKKYLIEEIFGNFDANNTSTFFYKKPDEYSEMIFAGPVWDYDGAVGNLTMYDKPNEYIVNINNSIWKELLKHKAFYNNVIIEYNTLFLSKLQEFQNSYIDNLVNEIYDSTRLDYIRWKNVSANSNEEFVYETYPTYEENINHLKSFLNERIEFLNSEWKNINKVRDED